MTATEELRRLLDERGVEWTDGGMFHRTHWVIDGVYHTAFEQDGKLYLQLSIGPLTAEQAIAATLGPGTCHNVHEPPKDTTFWPAPHFKCSECGATHVSMEYVFYCPNCGLKVVEPTTNDVDAEVD